MQMNLETAQHRLAGLFPEHLRVGPYHPVAKVYLLVTIFSLILLRRPAIDSSSAINCPAINAGVSPRVLASVRAVGATWGIGLLAAMYRRTGAWPLLSFTMQSWSWMTLRHVLGLVTMCSPKDSLLGKLATQMSEGTRFLALAQNTITVCVWWGVLVPAITFFLKDAKKRSDFLKLQRDPLLVSVHLLNLPLAAAEHLLHPRLFTPYDLWIGVTSALAYLGLYLRALDANGLHFYIILSPRTPLFPVSISALMLAYYGTFKGWNEVLKRLAV